MFDFLNKSISISFLPLVKINTEGDKLLETHTCRTYMAERMSCPEGSLLTLCDLTVRGELSLPTPCTTSPVTWKKYPANSVQDMTLTCVWVGMGWCGSTGTERRGTRV